MTRTAPRAISLENHKKKFPYDGPTRRGDRAGKTRTALLEMRMASQKQILLSRWTVGRWNAAITYSQRSNRKKVTTLKSKN